MAEHFLSHFGRAWQKMLKMPFNAFQPLVS